MPINDFLRLVRDKHTLYHYSKIFVETNSMQGIILKLPEAAGLPTVGVNTDKSKERRFTTMSSHFESKRVLVNPLLRSPTCEFYSEWVQFPRGGRDDALDSTEIVITNLLKSAPLHAFRFG